MYSSYLKKKKIGKQVYSKKKLHTIVINTEITYKEIMPAPPYQ